MKISLRMKFLIPTIFFITIATITTVLFTGHSMKNIVLAEIEKSTLSKLRDTVLISLTTMMDAGVIRQSKASFLQQMAHTADLRVIRSTVLDKAYGKGTDDELPKDGYEQEVMAQGVSKVFVEGAFIRGIYPYIAKRNEMGRNCLSCHDVPEGTVLGAISIKVPLGESFARIRINQYVYAAIGLSVSILLIILMLILAKSIFKPLEKMTEQICKVTKGDLSISFDHCSDDELGTLSLSMSEMIKIYRNLISKISVSSANLGTVVDKLSLEGIDGNILVVSDATSKNEGRERNAIQEFELLKTTSKELKVLADGYILS